MVGMLHLKITNQKKMLVLPAGKLQIAEIQAG
jgi:hypothetical protein